MLQPGSAGADSGTGAVGHVPAAIEAVEITSSSYTISRRFGVTITADIMVRNHSTRAIKDPTFTIACFGKSGTSIGLQSQTIYEVIEPGSKRWFRPEFTLCPDQTDSVRVSLADAQWR